MADQTDVPSTLDIAPRGLGRGPIWELPTPHQRFSPAEQSYPGGGDWSSYAAQWHVRDIDVDVHRGWMWMATWGGVLCWMPDARLCIRYTSEHGLIGNATRSLAVDQKGLIWAGGQNGGLCSLSSDEHMPWRPHSELRSWIVLRLAPRPGGGVYAALRDAESRCALGEIASADAHLRIRRDSLATKEIEALLVDEGNTLWVGNAWGLHRQQHDGTFETFESLDRQVHALAAGIGRGLWVGTDQGVCRFSPDKGSAHQDRDWPRDSVISLTVEPNTGSLWVATAREIGRIVDNAWQRLYDYPSGQLNELLTANPDVETRANIPAPLFREHHTWAGGAGGLFGIGVDEYRAAFTLDAEDATSNAVQCLWIDETTVWVGTARGLYRFDGQTWWSYDADAPSLRDVRAIIPGRTSGRLWVGSWQSGLHRFQSTVYVPDQPLSGPIVSMAVGDDGTMWAATVDKVYRRGPDSSDWNLVDPPARTSIRGAIIQTTCAAGETLWVGTSAGLWRYRPDPGLWYPPPLERQRVSVQALALDPLSSHLWVGTSAGLFSEDPWQCRREGDVRALAFDPEGTLWLGTASGLECWPAPGQGDVFDGEPKEYFTAANSGLAADPVTALAVRTDGDKQKVWIGSPAGVSCYSYQR